jgi:23S rRNA pseudouridine2605 synthase
LIDEGRVVVDGHTVHAQGVKIDPSSQEVRVDGRRVSPQPLAYFLLHKPRGVLCTSRDPQGRKIFSDLLRGIKERIYTVGRLDLDSEGLLLVTNDGSLAHRLTHPRYHVPRVYRVWTGTRLTPDDLAQARQGVHSEGEVLRVQSIEPWKPSTRSGSYRVVLAEGKKRQIRRIFGVLGHTVFRLRRVQMASLRLGALAPGAWRRLTREEVEALKRDAGMTP